MMQSDRIFAAVEEFELAYAGDDTLVHEKSAFERAGEQDDFCMICLKQKQNLYPILSPGEIHYCPRKFCDDCITIPPEWKYDPKPRVPPESLKRYHYYPAACWICEKRGWDYVSPLLGPNNPEWTRHPDSFHEIISWLRHQTWEMCDEGTILDDAPRMMYRKLPDKFSHDSDHQLASDRQLLEAMNLDLLKPGVRFAPLLRGSRSATQSLATVSPNAKIRGRPRKYQEHASFDAGLAFEGAYRWLQDHAATIVQGSGGIGMGAENLTTAMGSHEDDITQVDDFAVDDLENTMGDDDETYNPRKRRSHSSRKQIVKRQKSSESHVTSRSASSLQSSTSVQTQGQFVSTSAQPPPSPQQNLISACLPIVEDQVGMGPEFRSSMTIINKAKLWEDKYVKLGNMAMEAQANIKTLMEEFADGEEKHRATRTELEEVRSQLREETTRSTALTASAVITQGENDRLRAVAEAIRKQHDGEVQKLMTEITSLENAILDVKAAKEAAKAQAEEAQALLQQKTLELEDVRTISVERTRKLQRDFAATEQTRHNEAETAKQTIQELELRAQCQAQEQTELMSLKTVADLTIESLEKMLEECLSHNRTRRDMLKDERLENQYLSTHANALQDRITELRANETALKFQCQSMQDEERLKSQAHRSQLEALQASVDELRADGAAFGFELGRARRIHGATSDELRTRLAVGNVSPEMVDRLSSNQTFQNMFKAIVDLGAQPQPAIDPQPQPAIEHQPQPAVEIQTHPVVGANPPPATAAQSQPGTKVTSFPQGNGGHLTESGFVFQTRWVREAVATFQ